MPVTLKALSGCYANLHDNKNNILTYSTKIESSELTESWEMRLRVDGSPENTAGTFPD